MNPLDGLDAEELINLSDADFKDRVQKRARHKTADAMLAIEDVMNNSDDDQARLMAATKMLKIAKAEDETLANLPLGVSEEVFRIAIAGLGLAASIAHNTTSTANLRDVTPARSDPRPAFGLIEDPLNKPKPKAQVMPLEDDEAPGADLIEENINVEEE